MARAFLVIHFIAPMLIAVSILNGSVPTRSLNACLGQFELNYFEISTELCTYGTTLNQTLCTMGQLFYFAFSTNLIEVFMLFRCFKKIKTADDASKVLLDKTTYTRRRK